MDVENCQLSDELMARIRKARMTMRERDQEASAPSPVEIAPESVPVELSAPDRLALLIDKAKVWPRYAGKVVPNPSFNEMLDKGVGLYYVGGRGCGKTHSAWEVCLGYLDAHMTVYPYGARFTSRVFMMPCDEMLEEIRATFDGEGSSSEVIMRYAKAGLLVIDDLGKEVPTEWVRSKLFQIVNYRYNNMLPTIITSQYSPETLVERFARRGGRDDAEAICSRLHEMCFMVPMTSRDRRRDLAPARGSFFRSGAKAQEDTGPDALA